MEDLWSNLQVGADIVWSTLSNAKWGLNRLQRIQSHRDGTTYSPARQCRVGLG